MYNPNEITTIEQVKAFFTHLVTVRSLNFNPDESFDQYVEIGGEGKATFTDEEVKVYDECMERCWNICTEQDVCIYELSMSAHGWDELIEKENDPKA